MRTLLASLARDPRQSEPARPSERLPGQRRLAEADRRGQDAPPRRARVARFDDLD